MHNVQVKAEAFAEPIVYVVDDDEEMRGALLDLFMVTKKRATAFPNGVEFLETADTNAPGCVVVDLRMPGGTGLDLQKKLISIGSKMPIIFLTAYADIPTSVRAMKAGATDFITKPFINQDLLEAVDHAIQLDSERRKSEAESDRIRALAATLTPREKEVMWQVVSGLMNKQVAYELGISEMTVKLHRMSVMRKMESRSLADLVRKAEQLEKRDS
ncbi:response regulator transcription factor [Rhizobium sp. 16-449-1b]|jgi:FixJ family two-component response regulator|uniref:response regulator transcription factor n=1 Tax=Rhizobium sp. 16-449-1b TaxID=2819989 RepID=UPI000DD774E7|nr:response regulator [Rhizobium sp. 16-449-1b]MBO9198185.1 response regulator transcription factor [Rhizobium sp. 16-449-1b]